MKPMGGHAIGVLCGIGEVDVVEAIHADVSKADDVTKGIITPVVVCIVVALASLISQSNWLSLYQGMSAKKPSTMAHSTRLAGELLESADIAFPASSHELSESKHDGTLR